MTYEVEVLTGDDSEAAKMKERFERACTLRLESLAKKKKLPKAGEPFSILDNFEGKLVAERTDDEIADDPPSEVYFTVEKVESKQDKMRVVLRLEY